MSNDNDERYFRGESVEVDAEMYDKVRGGIVRQWWPGTVTSVHPDGRPVIVRIRDKGFVWYDQWKAIRKVGES